MGLNCHDLSDMEIEALMSGFRNVHILKTVRTGKGAFHTFASLLFICLFVAAGEKEPSIFLTSNCENIYKNSIIQPDI